MDNIPRMGSSIGHDTVAANVRTDSNSNTKFDIDIVQYVEEKAKFAHSMTIDSKDPFRLRKVRSFHPW